MKKILSILLAAALILPGCKKSTPVSGVTLDKTSIELTEGGTQTLVSTIFPADADNRNVSWSSSNPSVATVEQSGKVTAVASGTANVTVTTEDGGKTATCKVTVSSKIISVTGVTLDKTKADMTVGDSLTLVATVAPENATDKTVSWSSDKTEFATVDNQGNVHAVAPGIANITVTTTDGNKTATCVVTVKAAFPEGALPGEFSVGATKKVQFSRGNLYWDGDSYEFEANQYTIGTWNAENHVNYFFWSKEESVAKAASYADASAAAGDVFFTNATAVTAKADFTVSGVTGEFRTLSAEEWTHILSTRANAVNLLVEDVTVCDVEHCLVIAPDACLNSYVFDKTKKSYDAAAWATAEAAGLICLPPAGYRDGTDIKSGEGNGFYWASTTDAADKASNLGFKKSDN